MPLAPGRPGGPLSPVKPSGPGLPVGPEGPRGHLAMTSPGGPLAPRKQKNKNITNVCLIESKFSLLINILYDVGLLTVNFSYILAAGALTLISSVAFVSMPTRGPRKTTGTPGSSRTSGPSGTHSTCQQHNPGPML